MSAPESKTCTRCGQMLPLDDFYYVSRKLGTRRGQCKPCMSEIKQEQKDPKWRPSCSRCGAERDRVGMGRRLCDDCFRESYDSENRRPNGSHRIPLKPCPGCGAKRLRADHQPGTMMCPVCRAVPQGYRKRLRVFYNLNVKQYLALLAASQHACAICKRKPRKRLHVDHRHRAPMIVRGLICGTCNTMLATARDSPEILRSAAAYLENPPAQELLPGHEATAAANSRAFNPITRKAGASHERAEDVAA